MARITDSDVEGVIAVDDSIDLTPFITVANELVTELCTDSGYTDARLALVETWLAAHCYAIRDNPVSMEKAGSVNVSYQYKVDLALDQTRHGQMAMLIDTAGNLAKLNQRIKEGESATVSLNWHGEDYDATSDE